MPVRVGISAAVVAWFEAVGAGVAHADIGGVALDTTETGENNVVVFFVMAGYV